MSTDFNWWLVLVGLVAGGALTWLVLADSQRRERDIGDEELSAEAGWIARTLDDARVDAERAERVLRAHRRYLRFPPPDTLVDPETLRELDPATAQVTVARSVAATSAVEEPDRETDRPA